MSLSLRLRQFHIPKCKGDKVAKVEFRGVLYVSRLLEDKGEWIIVDQRFVWPTARGVEGHEEINIQVFCTSRYLSDKLVGSYKLTLQRLIIDGKLNVSDSLLGPNNKPLPASVEFEVCYTPPVDTPSTTYSSWVGSQTLDTDQEMLMRVEENIAHLERNFLDRRNSVGSQMGSLDQPDLVLHPQSSPYNSGSEKSPEKKRLTLKNSVKSLMKLGKQRPSKDKEKLIRDDSHGQRDIQMGQSEPVIRRTTSVTSISSDNESVCSNPEFPSRIQSKLKKLPDECQSLLKAQDFQICITIIEARQLAGLNMDPVVCVQVGDVKKYTSVKESTNCPYYNEYFVFDFHMPAIMLFDKIISLSVLQSRKILRSDKMLGSFKLDVATVWAQTDHQFYHRWALLTDPEDIAGGPKGYLKCDISVVGKGDSVKVPPKSEKDEDDIEANLLLPDGVPMERQRAKFIVKIYRADGLPKMNSSIVANVKKAFTREVRDLVDPYVQVSFAGLTGKTSIKKNSYAPVWNEEIIFSEMFPPLCQRIKIQLRDDSVKRAVIGTHFVDLKTISNDGDKGFLPTFGPNFIHLYGSTRDYNILDEHANLNLGLGEGVSYRGRLLVAIRTEITDNVDVAPAEVEVEPTYPITEASYSKNEEFFLFTTVLEATMIDKKLSDKPMFFELSVGNAGNMLDGYNESSHNNVECEGDEQLEHVTSESWQSSTSASKPMTHDRIYYYLPYWEDKPCLHVRSVWPDHRRRMYNSNLIAQIIEKLEEGLSEVQSSILVEDSDAEKKLKVVLEELSMTCARYTTISKSSSSGSGTGKTKLDKERTKMCLREIDLIGGQARTLKALVTKNSLKERFKTAHSYLTKLKSIMEDPQHSLPDVFIWLISNGKRTAYQRIPARDLIFSVVNEESGRWCSKVRSLFLKLPGKKGIGPSGWTIQAKLQIYMWMGLLKHKMYFVNGLPKGYEVSHEISNAERPRALPPSVIHYTMKYSFQMRAYIYQARSLIGSDASGLSDPFARVIISEYCRTTQVIDETLSPTWDELLVFDEILIYGVREEIKNDPPIVIIEIFDQDKVGKSEFIGRAIAKPHVKLLEEPYSKPNFPPSLEWYEIHRGLEQAGELLATFELLELPNRTATANLPELPEPKITSVIPIQSPTEAHHGPVLPVPKGIRPTLAKYRIEALFWGLRDLKRIHLMSVDRPRVDIECAGHILNSSVIQNAKKNPNFSNPVKFLDLELPEQELYRPPLTIRAIDCRSFGRFTLVGTHMINSIHKYMYQPVTRKERELEERKRSTVLAQNGDVNNVNTFVTSNNEYTNYNRSIFSNDRIIYFDMDLPYFSKKAMKTEFNRKRKASMVEDYVDDDDESRDWWTKYFASVEATIEEGKEARKENVLQTNGGLYADHPDTAQPKNAKHNKLGPSTAAKLVAKLSPKTIQRKQAKKIAKIKIYSNELEAQSEFNGFREWLLPFDLYRGKKTGDDSEDENRIVGTFKGSIKVYKWPLPKDIEDHTIMGFDPQYGFFQGLPSNDPIHVLVRVYIIKANDLHPMDLNGKADPYIVLQLGSKKINDKDNYISKQLNPVFGKCFEIEATFPQDSMLTIQVLDWDLVGSDDLIGETRIDLENRFYSRHRATCGLSRKYEDFGYNQWRDPMKPTQILGKLCKDAKMEVPIYSNGKVKVGKHTFCLQPSSETSSDWFFVKGIEEHMALAVLHNWHDFPRIGCELVPEHIETRPLYNPEKLGIEQGKLEMWVDLFPMDMPLPGPPIDISPRKPKSYELRVIIWNTDEVVLEDDAFFTGEKMSDIYVKGWLKGPEDCQSTDIHYRSLTGEGNFNWRFIFPFDYLVAEEKIVISKKESLFSWDESESKIPVRLELQVWDADHFSADDFLGAITLDLNRFPRGAKSSKLCTLSMLQDSSVPMINIFKQKRVKGWWPFYVKKENEEMELTGKVEAELHLLTQEEAEKNPAGQGRSEPDPLDKPNRPDASFMWLLNPLKSIRYIVWHNYKWKILKALIFLALFFMIFLFIYAVPGYSVKLLLGA
ncbi:otoferlin [Bemisia tabaci]|uniref:otoferlin n=1 Tax=Bemisia tabaci TaxID=7038 RepID=UPI003B2876DF